MTMTTDQPTDEQRADWQELVDRMKAVRERQDEAEREVLSCMRLWAESPSGHDWIEEAKTVTRQMLTLRDEWSAMFADYQAHPYTAVVVARSR